MTKYDFLVVGAGFAGATMARELTDAGYRVRVIDQRDHIAGNAYDHYDGHGVLVHKYGPHIFHTNSDMVWEWLSRFTDWRPYEHRVQCLLPDVGMLPFPINRTTLEKVYRCKLETEEDTAWFLDLIREPQSHISNSEQVVLHQVGRIIYQAFFKGYTTKMWDKPPSEIAASVAARIPVRTNRDDRYFTDKHQAMPLHGYTRMFENILDGIRVDLNTFHEETEHDYDRIIWTGPIDQYWGFQFGQLPYRSIRFVHEHLNQDSYQPVGTVNYPGLDTPRTRTTEFKKLTGQQCPGTSIVHEYPTWEGDPYYPMQTQEARDLYNRYRDLKDDRVVFAGRLGTYSYLNMDQCVAQALKRSRQIIENKEIEE